MYWLRPGYHLNADGGTWAEPGLSGAPWASSLPGDQGLPSSPRLLALSSRMFSFSRY